MRAAILALTLLAGCNEETHQRILFSNCVNGNAAPEYAEVVAACAKAAIELREQTKRATAQKDQP